MMYCFAFSFIFLYFYFFIYSHTGGVVPISTSLHHLHHCINFMIYMDKCDVCGVVTKQIDYIVLINKDKANSRLKYQLFIK